MKINISMLAFGQNACIAALSKLFTRGAAAALVRYLDAAPALPQLSIYWLAWVVWLLTVTVKYHIYM